MTKSELTNIIADPSLISSDEIVSLGKLISGYPYCQTFQILLAKGMHSLQSIGYAEQLKLTAITVSDRKKLYELIMRESLLRQIEATEKNVEFITEPKAQPEPTPEKKSSAEDVAPVETKTTEAPEISSAKETRTLANELKEKIIIKEELPPVVIVTEPKTSQEIPEKSKISESVEKNIPIEKPEYPQEKKEDSKERTKISGLEQEILYEAINASIQNEVWTAIVDEHPEVLVPTSDNLKTEKEITEGPKDFYSWLHAGGTDKTSKKEDIKESKKFEDTDALQSGIVDNSRIIPTGQVKNLDELIDRFIRNDPKITPARSEFYSPTNVAKLSIVDKEEFVSETLAKIYEKQGYFDKAIKVYQQLSLKFPEKSVYFASLIEKTELQKALEKQKKNK